MFKTKERIIQVRCIDTHSKELIKAYLQGCVYCWCNTKGTEWFSAKDFLGGDNFYWEDTPMYSLYAYFLDGKQENQDYAFGEACKAAGKLLKIVLDKDKRIFEAKDGFAKSYRWTGD